MYEEVFLEDEILLRATLHDLLKDLSSGLAQDIERVLSAPGKILSQDIAVDSHRIPRAIWALLAIHIARYCQPQGDQGQAVRVALSLECLMTALDCLDDVEDTDDTFLRRSLSDARLCNVSTALLSLSHSLILSLPSTLLQQFLLFTHEHLLEAIQGQHQDLISENEPLATYSAEQALAIAHPKSGSLFSLVCHVTALAFEVPLLAESFA